MHTLLPRLLRFTAALALFFAPAVPVQATPPTRTFQLPDSRHSHTFKLWQQTGSTFTTRETTPGDPYIVEPDHAYYFEVHAAVDAGVDKFWLEDTYPGVNEYSAPNTLNLTHCLWKTASSTPQQYLALAIERQDHAFSLQQAGGATYQVTKGGLQKIAEVNPETGEREWLSLGYFEGGQGVKAYY